MPESRDRLIREDPISIQQIFHRRSVGGSTVWIDTEQDQGFGNGGAAERRHLGSPFQFGSMGTRGSLLGSRGVRSIGRIGNGGTGSRRGSGNPRLGGQENRNLGVNGRSTLSLLPAWYPRRPLQDITTVLDAIERRRTRLREAETHRQDSPLQQQGFNTPVANAPSVHSISLTSPMSAGTLANFKLPLHVRTKNLQGNQGDGETNFMTPQKKLLNSIDQVEKVMKEELKRMKMTPKAKKVERDNKVRTLMAMR